MSLPLDWLTIARYASACTEDEGLAPILADLVDDYDAPVAARLRAACHLPDLWAAARLCSGTGLAVARRCKAQVEQWAREVRSGRISDRPASSAGPEYTAEGYLFPSLRECEGDEPYRQRCLGVTPPLRQRWLCSYLHCWRLVSRCLLGHDVPPDVQRRAMHHVGVIRLIIRQVVPDWACAGAEDDVVLGDTP